MTIFRDDVSERWRHVQSDPIGLNGGQMSTYAYVDSNLINATDRFGLWSTAAHNYLLKLLGEKLCWSSLETSWAQNGSKYADNFLRGKQSAANSHIHAMTSSANRNRQETESTANNYVAGMMRGFNA